MKNLITTICFALIIAAPSTAFSQSFGPACAEAMAPGFRENKGQVFDQHYQPRPDILFSASDGNLNYHIRKNGLSYQQNQVTAWMPYRSHADNNETTVPSAISYCRTDVEWLGANPNSNVSPSGQLTGHENFYLPSCPGGVTYVHTYEGYILNGIYPGISAKFSIGADGFKYDWLVAAGADYSLIKMKISGSNGISVDAEGNLVIQTPWSSIVESKPAVFQGGRKLEASWIVEGESIRFQIVNVDPQLPMVIDPAVRLWGTYYGGSASETVRGAVADPSGNVLVAGTTTTGGGSLLASVGAHQGTYAGGIYDGFAALFSGTGQRLWGTYYGGTGSDEGLACATDASGNAYVTGVTQSTAAGVMASAGSHQAAHGGGADDAYLVKFDANGVRLWATYYGSQGGDVGHACAVDASGNPFVTGYTTSQADIATAGAHQSALAGLGDLFIVKFDPAGTRQWGTYIGSIKQDRPYACATDLNGNIYLTGVTDSTVNYSGIATAGSHQPAPGGGIKDAFLIKFSGSGTRLWGTYYGGNSEDDGRACATDQSGNVYIGGHTYSPTGISTAGSHQPSYYSTRDGFLAKFDPSGNRLWATYYGGGLGEWVSGLTTDAMNHVYMTGWTTSTDSIATPGAFQTAKVSIQDDAFLVLFDSTGARQWGTYYGDLELDWGVSCPVDANGDVFLAGVTQAVSNISTAGAHQAAFGGGFGDAYVVKFDVSFPASQDDGIDDASFVSLFPNPSDGVFFLVSEVKGAVYSVFDMNGKEVLAGSLTEQTTALDLGASPEGVYLVRVLAGEKQWSQLLVKQGW